MADTSPTPGRVFTDADGIEWTVVEIANPALPPSLEKMLSGERRRSGWLVFQSAGGERRRLAPYPANWRDVSDYEMERWCMRAMRVPPGPQRRAQD